MPFKMHNNMQDTKLRTLRRAALWTTLLATLALSGCANMAGRTPQEQVSQRINERWKALVAADFKLAYSYNTPGFRMVITPDSYRNRIGSAVKWIGAQAVKVDCPEATTCNATVRLDYQPVLAGGSGTFSTHIDETWLLEEGQWWIFQPIASK